MFGLPKDAQMEGTMLYLKMEKKAFDTQTTLQAFYKWRFGNRDFGVHHSQAQPLSFLPSIGMSLSFRAMYTHFLSRKSSLPRPIRSVSISAIPFYSSYTFSCPLTSRCSISLP